MLLMTFRIKEQGGLRPFLRDLRLRMVNACIRTGKIGIVDVEIDSDTEYVQAIKKTAAAYGTKVLLSFHDPQIAEIMSAHAKLVQIGLPGKVPPIDMTPFIYHGTSVYCCSGSAGSDSFPSVLRMFSAGVLDMRGCIGGRFPLEQTHRAIQKAGSGGAGKILVSQFYE